MSIRRLRTKGTVKSRIDGQMLNQELIHNTEQPSQLLNVWEQIKITSSGEIDFEYQDFFTIKSR